MQIKYNSIGTGYNNTRQADPYLAERLFSLLAPGDTGLYLDIGCGTGNYTNALQDKGLQFTGVDPSEKMLNEARMRNPYIYWRVGTAEQIPANAQTFKGVIATLTIHHWADVKRAFAEISRVLSDDGRLVLFTSTPQQMQRYWLNHYFPEMLHASIAQMPSLDVLTSAAESAKLKIIATEKYFIKDDLQDCFLYIGKNRPERYFDEKVRKGISSFSALANAAEVENGLKALRKDIENNVFGQIKQQYDNDLGDYLFIVIEKDQIE